MATKKFKAISITKPEDYQLVYHSNQQGQIWLDAKNRPIPLSQPLTGHIDSTDPVLLWNSRVTREGYHSVPVAISRGSAINSTAITQQPPAHSTPTSPIQNSLTIPQGVDPNDEILQGLMNDPQIPRSSVEEAFGDASSKIGKVITPQKPEGALNDANLETNSDTSETSMVNDDKVLPPNSKTYSQKDVDRLLEQSRLQDITDKRNLETHIRNQYSAAMENLKMEHQEQIASMETNIAKKLQKEIQKIQATSDQRIAQYVESIQLLQQEVQTLQQSNPNTPHMPDYNQPINNETGISLLSSTIEHTLRQNTALHKEHYISSAKTYDGKDPKEFNKWLDNVDRLSRILNRDHLDIAISTSLGQLYKYISELTDLGLNWDMIKPLIQERFSECGSSIIARNRLTSLAQETRVMHEYISEFSSLMEHAHGIKPTDPKSKILASNFIDGIQNPHIKNKLRMQDPDNLSALYRCAIKEDQRQKIRELDFGKSSPQASAQFDINAIKGSGCYKCGSNDHFIKDCPLNREKDSDLTHGQKKHYNDYRSKSHDENSMEKSIQAITDLLKSLLKQNKPSHPSMNRSTHRHSYTNKHSDHKPSYKHPNHRPNKSDNRGYHDKAKYRHNTRINELGECTSDASSCSSCSDQSDMEEEFHQQEPPTSDNSKN